MKHTLATYYRRSARAVTVNPDTAKAESQAIMMDCTIAHMVTLARFTRRQADRIYSILLAE